jgi:hypothetical protein
MRYVNVCRCDRTDRPIGFLSGVFYSVVDRHRFDADPDPLFLVTQSDTSQNVPKKDVCEYL